MTLPETGDPLPGAGGLEQSFPVPEAYDLRATLTLYSGGRFDPTVRLDADGYWRALRTPEGPACFQLTPCGARVRARAWGEGAAWTLRALPEFLGLHDDPSAFRPRSDPVRRLALRFREMRLPRVAWGSEIVLRVILAQRVAGAEAKRSFRLLAERQSAPAPGPAGLLLPPDPKWLSRLDSRTFTAAGVDRQRAGALREAAWHAGKLDDLSGSDPESARKRLYALRGCGPWTVEMVIGLVLGHPDAVPEGDYNLPNTVAWALAGEPRADDRRMQELLEPFRGQRLRLIRLLHAAGLSAPRRGPRLPPPGPPRR